MHHTVSHSELVDIDTSTDDSSYLIPNQSSFLVNTSWCDCQVCQRLHVNMTSFDYQNIPPTRVHQTPEMQYWSPIHSTPLKNRVPAFVDTEMTSRGRADGSSGCNVSVRSLTSGYDVIRDDTYDNIETCSSFSFSPPPLPPPRTCRPHRFDDVIVNTHQTFGRITRRYRKRVYFKRDVMDLETRQLRDYCDNVDDRRNLSSHVKRQQRVTSLKDSNKQSVIIRNIDIDDHRQQMVAFRRGPPSAVISSLSPDVIDCTYESIGDYESIAHLSDVTDDIIVSCCNCAKAITAGLRAKKANKKVPTTVGSDASNYEPLVVRGDTLYERLDLLTRINEDEQRNRRQIYTEQLQTAGRPTPAMQPQNSTEKFSWKLAGSVEKLRRQSQNVRNSQPPHRLRVKFHQRQKTIEDGYNRTVAPPGECCYDEISRVLRCNGKRSRRNDSTDCPTPVASNRRRQRITSVASSYC